MFLRDAEEFDSSIYLFVENSQLVNRTNSIVSQHNDRSDSTFWSEFEFRDEIVVIATYLTTDEYEAAAAYLLTSECAPWWIDDNHVSWAASVEYR